MIYGVLADLLLFVHFTFMKFVAVGGFAVLRWRWIRWIHLPAAVLGAGLAFAGWLWPFEGLERWLRERGAMRGYTFNLIDRLLPDAFQPAALPRPLELFIGVVVVVVNVFIYRRVFRTAPATLSASPRNSHGH
ncbi:MAG: DUF2784 domain-containing protein [Gemmatimonadales bacterium]